LELHRGRFGVLANEVNYQKWNKEGKGANCKDGELANCLFVLISFALKVLFFKQKCIKINSYEFAIQSLNLRNVVY
jgi:hypothetical protein